jgi:NADH-quinone oxidoreductase subunit G
MPQVIVDGQTVELEDHERLNGIEVARRVGVEIPHYCWHPGLSVVASCRMCLVETGTRHPQTGEIQILPKLVPACQTPARDGTVFITNSEKVKHSRALVEEALLWNHPVDCPICDKAGECQLQDYYFEHGQPQRRADIRPFTSRRRDVGPTVTLFVDRCVMCSRCVRFCREVAGTSELMVVHRGSHEEIDVFPGYPLANKLAGNVVDLCPVGALGDKDFLYRQRVWFLRRHEGVCAGCATGCSLWIEENQQRIWRLKPRTNPHVNKWWICDDGRYSYHHVHREDRLVGVRRRVPEGSKLVEWSAAVEAIPAELAGAQRLAGVFSPHLTVEEAWLLATLLRRQNPHAKLFLGPVPRSGQDEKFPGGFTIRAEKCPNRLGVEAVLWHFMGCLRTWEELLEELAAAAGNGTSAYDAVWVAGGYIQPWMDEGAAARFAHVPLLVVQDLFPSPLAEAATWLLPAAAFAERDGSYVNAQYRLQSFCWAVRPPVGVWSQGQLYWRMLGRSGLFDARAALREAARDVSALSAAIGDIPPLGIDLRTNLLAAT